MFFRNAILCLFGAVLIATVGGCQQSSPLNQAKTPTALSPDTIASVHWLGKKEVGITFGAYYFSRIWQQPQTAQLERQTLYKLAIAPSLWLPNGNNLTTNDVPRLWQLLNDLVQEESYLEIRHADAARPQVVFAIKLSNDQAAQWLTNLPALLEPLLAVHQPVTPSAAGWTLQTTDTLNRVQCVRLGSWLLVGAAADANPLLSEITTRIHRDGVPFISAGTNLWLEANLKPSSLAVTFPALFQGDTLRPSDGRGWREATGEGQPAAEGGSSFRSQVLAAPKPGEGGSIFHLLSSLSAFNLSLSGDGANVITRAHLKLAKPMVESLTPWQLPLPLLHEPLASFTAMRGIQPLLEEWDWWKLISGGTPPPDQLFLWSLSGSPYQVYLAASLPDPLVGTPGSDVRGQGRDASLRRPQVASLCDALMTNGNPWLAAHGYISFDREPDGNGVTWGNLPDIRPFIKFAGDSSEGWLYAGLTPDTDTNHMSPPQGMIQYILQRTNLLYYDWEVTGPRMQPVLTLAQTTRQVVRSPELPLNSASLTCLGSIIQRLGTSASMINRTGPAELTFYRRSTLGFTAIELQLIADWLESPQFPRGLHSIK